MRTVTDQIFNFACILPRCSLFYSTLVSVRDARGGRAAPHAALCRDAVIRHSFEGFAHELSNSSQTPLFAEQIPQPKSTHIPSSAPTAHRFSSSDCLSPTAHSRGWSPTAHSRGWSPTAHCPRRAEVVTKFEVAPKSRQVCELAPKSRQVCELAPKSRQSAEIAPKCGKVRKSLRSAEIHKFPSDSSRFARWPPRDPQILPPKSQI